MGHHSRGYFARWPAMLLAVVLAGLTSGTATAAAEHSSPQEVKGEKVSARFVHTVFFWLKPGTSEQAGKQLISDCRDILGKIPTVRFIAAGKPAGTPRTVVDNSYAVGLVVHFDDKAGHDHYQDAPLHKEFIERNQAIWERVQVYDLITE